MRILLAEDDADLRDAVRESLLAAGHVVDAEANGSAALAMLRSYPYDLAVLDIVLPGRSGLEVCLEARRARLGLPVLLLTARDTLKDKVEGLDAGADDYLTKPFELPELLARVRALLRRTSDRKAGVLEVGPLRFDPASGEASHDGHPIVLTRKLRSLFELFMRHPGHILGLERIVDHVWDLEDEPEPNAVRAQVKLLRKAIGDTGDPRLIQTVHGLGYRLAADAQGAP
jgi:DNA-binding response OmpR family regulator